MIYVLCILFNHPNSEATPNSKITGAYSIVSRALWAYNGGGGGGVGVKAQSTECQAFFSVVRIGSPRSLTRKRVFPPPSFSCGGGDTLACKRWGGGNQFGRKDRHSGTLWVNNTSLHGMKNNCKLSNKGGNWRADFRVHISAIHV